MGLFQKLKQKTHKKHKQINKQKQQQKQQQQTTTTNNNNKQLSGLKHRFVLRD